MLAFALVVVVVVVGVGVATPASFFLFARVMKTAERNATKLYFMIHRFCLVCEVFLPQVT